MSSHDSINSRARRLRLYISSADRQQARQQSENYSNQLASFNAYLNYVCLHTFFNWLKDWFAEDSFPEPSIHNSSDRTSNIWEFVNGAAIDVGQKRIVLIPSETIDLEEFSVPQEWVDIPSFAGDYYFAIRVNMEIDDSDEDFLEICGFTTHRQLRNLSQYDPRQRAYILPLENLIINETLIESTLNLNLQEVMTELPHLSDTDAEKLLKLLGNKSIYSPRLQVDIPFEQWAALIENDQWRSQLYKRRTGTLVNNLSNWLNNIFEAGWESLDTILNPQVATLAFRNRDLDSTKKYVERVKLIDKGMLLGEQSVALLVGSLEEQDNKVRIRVQLHPANGEAYLPLNVKLALLSESGTAHKEIISRSQDNMIQLPQFTCVRGKRFKIQVAIDNFSIIEDFIV